MDKRQTAGAIPWTGGLQERQHPLLTGDDAMSQVMDAELGFDGRKSKRRDVRDVMGIVYVANSASTAYSS